MTLEKVETNQAIEADIQLSGAKVGAVITAQLFGHNLEHTRRAIWRGLSAQMVANRKFAAVTVDRPNSGGRWLTTVCRSTTRLPMPADIPSAWTTRAERIAASGSNTTG